jgi:DUF4097 and DUF4098 domain-containing protein YvlB
MKKTQMLMLAALMLAATMSSAQQLRREGKYYVAEITKNFTATPGGMLRLTRIRGDVDVQAWAKKEVFIRQTLRFDVYTEGEAQRALDEMKSAFSQIGDVIEITGESGRDWIDAKYTISAPSDFRIDVSTSGGDISVREMKGDIKLRTSGGDIDLTAVGGPVRASTSGGDITLRTSTGDVDLKTSGGDLVLENVLGMLRGSTSGGDISLVGAKKDVDLHTSGGDIDIREVSGRLEANTSGGDIVVEKCDGEVEVATSGGDVTVRNTGGSTRASTSGGDVEVYNINGSIVVSTSGGDLTLRDVRGAIDGSTSGGDVTASLSLTDFTKPHPVNLRSSGGSIELTIPEKLPATIRAEITMGRGGWGSLERYEIISDFPLSISKDKSLGREIIRAEGSINGGGDLITLTTSEGNITIRKKP